MNQLEFDALVGNGSVGELKNALAFLRVELKKLSKDYLVAEGKIVERQHKVVEALARRILLEASLK
jgi:hypothetical protein